VLIISGRFGHLKKAGFKVVRQGKHVVMTDGTHFLTIPRHNPVNAITMGGIVKDAGLTPSNSKSCSECPPWRAVASAKAADLRLLILLSAD
jgi:predicted RNA binding protein YcfA (HicA-like mRNA interferase family)